jgi:hypothetical protein
MCIDTLPQPWLEQLNVVVRLQHISTTLQDAARTPKKSADARCFGFPLNVQQSKFPQG